MGPAPGDVGHFNQSVEHPEQLRLDVFTLTFDIVVLMFD